MNQNTLTCPAPHTELTGQQLISHAGLNVLGGFLNALDFQGLCENKFSQLVPATTTHRPGKILADVTLMLTAGGEQACDVDLLRTNPGVFGPGASEATVSRFMDRSKDKPEAFTHGYQTMSRTLRTKLWAAAGPRSPAKRATKRTRLILDIDATLIRAH